MSTIFVPNSGKATSYTGVCVDSLHFIMKETLLLNISNIHEDNLENVLVATFYANWFQANNPFSLVDSKYTAHSTI